jgi:outer membrane protein TolC
MLDANRRLARLLPVCLCLGLASICAQQPPQKLTLADALALATGRSENVEIARAGLRSAEAELTRARAGRLPQLFGNATYTRTIFSQYEGLFGSSSRTQPVSPCDPLNINPNASTEQRLSEMERFLLCGGPAASPGGPGFQGGLDDLPFGRENIWVFGLSVSQPVFTGGRIPAQLRLANSLREAARIEIDSSNAQFLLDVSQAFYDAALADQLLEIARATLADAEKTLEFVQLGFRVGRLPEFDVLRATVARRNRLPAVVRGQAQRNQAYLRLKQLIEYPLPLPVELASDLSETPLPVPAPFAEKYRESEALQTVFDRAPVRQAQAVVAQREANLDVAESQRWPSISVSSDFGLFGYPRAVVPTALDQFFKNWTVTASLQVPILTFGRIKADIQSAEAALQQAQAQRRLTRELALLDTSVILNQLQTAREQWEAAAGGVVEARRAFEIAGLRYREGISSQLELDDARLGLQEAEVNRAQAARDLQVARITVALLPLLPINTGPVAPSQTRPLQQQQSEQFGVEPSNPFNVRGATAQPPNAAGVQSGLPGVPAGQAGVPGVGGRPVQ